MKKNIFFIPLILALFLGNTKRPQTIDDLKEYIGLRCSDIEKTMKNKGFADYDKEEDDEEGPFTKKYFYSDDDDYINLSVYCDKSGKTTAASSEDFTPEDYKQILNYFKKSNYKKLYAEVMTRATGFERADLWESGDGKWQVKILYSVYSEEKPQEITLSTGIDWGYGK